MTALKLTAEQAASAAAIQRAIDALAAEGGGQVVLPAMELTLDRGLELRSRIELIGQGERTVLRKARGRVYPLAGYHNYGMCDAPLRYTAGLEPGMTVALRDNAHGGFFETLARITWVEGDWVGLDQGLHADYEANQEPVLATAYPLVWGRGVEQVAVRGLTLDGARDEQPAGIGACRGAAVYFIHSREFTVEDVTERDFAGEGLGFQMCSHGRIRRCRFEGNAGNGYHPGAGSTAVLFEDCAAERNDRDGFFFCVRANHITVRGCSFERNHGAGLTVGTRDCHNLIEHCRLSYNDGPGLLLRHAVRPVEVHSCIVRGCTLEGNARLHGHGQVEIAGDAHDVVIEGNLIRGLGGVERAGVYIMPTAERIWLAGNDIAGCWPDVVGRAACSAGAAPALECGLEAVREEHFRHLPLPSASAPHRS